MAKQFKKISLEDLVTKLTEESTSTENPSKEEMVDFISKTTKIYSPEDLLQMNDNDIVNIYNELQDETIGVNAKFGKIGEEDYKSDEDIESEFETPIITQFDYPNQSKRGYIYLEFPEAEEHVGGGSTQTSEDYFYDETTNKLKFAVNNWYPEATYMWILNQIMEKLNEKYGKYPEVVKYLDEYVYGVDPMMSEESKDVNPWAICHASVGPKKNAKFEKCVKGVKKQYNIDEAEPGFVEKQVYNMNESDNSNEYYQVDYYATIGEHGALDNPSNDFDEQLAKAVKFYKSEQKSGSIKELEYIGVEGNGDKFAVIYMTPSYFNRIKPNWFKDKDEDNYNTYKNVAQKALDNPGKAYIGKYPTNTEDMNEMHHDAGNNMKRSAVPFFGKTGTKKSNKKENLYVFDSKGRKVKVSIPSKEDEAGLTENWTGKLQKQYNSFEEFEAFDEIYNLSSRLGFESAEEAWEANPQIQGSTDPADYKVVKENDIDGSKLFHIASLIKQSITNGFDPFWELNVELFDDNDVEMPIHKLSDVDYEYIADQVEQGVLQGELNITTPSEDTIRGWWNLNLGNSLDELASMISENEEIATLYNQLSDEEKDNLIKEFVQAEKASYNNKTNNPSMNNLNKIKGENEKNNKAHEKEVSVKLKGAEADGTQFVSEKGNEKGEVEPKSFSQEKAKMAEDEKQSVADAIMLNRGGGMEDLDYAMNVEATDKKIKDQLIPDLGAKKVKTQYGTVESPADANIDSSLKVNKQVYDNMLKKREFRKEMPKSFNRYTTKLVAEGISDLELKTILDEIVKSGGQH